MNAQKQHPHSKQIARRQAAAKRQDEQTGRHVAKEHTRFIQSLAALVAQDVNLESEIVSNFLRRNHYVLQEEAEAQRQLNAALMRQEIRRRVDRETQQRVALEEKLRRARA